MTQNVTPQSAGEQSDLPEWLQDITQDGARPASESVQQKISTFSVVALLVIIGLLGIIGYALWQRSQSTPTSGPAPQFDVTMFSYDPMAMSGESVSLKELRGQAVVINFWASYCIPCQEEAPMLERVWNDYRDQGVVFLGINTEDPEKEALDYLAQYKITYPNAPDHRAKIENAYRITGIPETFIINTNGEIVRHFLSQPNERDLRAEIERAMNG